MMMLYQLSPVEIRLALIPVPVKLALIVVALQAERGPAVSLVLKRPMYRTGLLPVGVMVGVGDGPEVGVRVRVDVGPVVAVRVRVAVGPFVGVRVGVALVEQVP